MDIGSLLLGLALLALIAFVVARPLLERAAPEEAPVSPADQLLAERDRVLAQLRDLDFDQTMGKINQEDYAAQRAQLVADGVALLKQLDALGVGADDAVSTAAPADDIEAAVAQRRGRSALAPTSMKAADSQRGLDAQIEAHVAQRRAASPARPPAAPPALAKAKTPNAPPAASSLEAEIEASVAQRRAAGVARPVPSDVRDIAAPFPVVDKPATAASLTCGQCGAAVLPDDRFCPKCGTPQMIACGHCGRVARAGDQFCAQCGQSLPAPDGQASLQS